MKRKGQELLERAAGNERWKEEPTDQQADGLEVEFDQEFWIKVSNLYDFFKNNLLKSLNTASLDCVRLINMR